MDSAADEWRERLEAEVCELGPVLDRGHGYQTFEARLDPRSEQVAFKVFTGSAALMHRLPLRRAGSCAPPLPRHGARRRADAGRATGGRGAQP